MEILIVIDAQNDFITGKLAVPGAEEVVKNIRKELQNRNAYPIFTKDLHKRDEYMLSVEGKNIPEHCVCEVGDIREGSELHKSLLIDWMPIDDVVFKSTFAYTDWKPYLKQRAFNCFGPQFDITGITLMGFCTDICVLSNAIVLRSLFPNIPIRVKSDCCAGSTPALHEAALKIMAANLIEIV